MSKELNIIEASNMPIGTEFYIYVNGVKQENRAKFYGDYEELVCIRDDNKTNNLYAGKSIINAKFVQIQKSVSFEEAICSNKRIKVVVPKELNNKYTNGITCLLNDSWNNEYETVEEILKMLAGHGKREVLIKECKWYIEEE